MSGGGGNRCDILSQLFFSEKVHPSRCRGKKKTGANIFFGSLEFSDLCSYETWSGNWFFKRSLWAFPLRRYLPIQKFNVYGLLPYVAIYPYKNSTSRSRAKHQNTWNDFPRFSSDRKMAVQYSTVLYSSAGSLVRSSSSIIQYRPYLRIIQRMYHMISHDNRTMYYCTV